MDEPEMLERRGRGRPRGTDKVQVAVRVPEMLLERVRTRARDEDKRVSDLIRDALGNAFPESGVPDAVTIEA